MLFWKAFSSLSTLKENTAASVLNPINDKGYRMPQRTLRSLSATPAQEYEEQEVLFSEPFNVRELMYLNFHRWKRRIWLWETPNHVLLQCNFDSVIILLDCWFNLIVITNFISMPSIGPMHNSASNNINSLSAGQRSTANRTPSGLPNPSRYLFINTNVLDVSTKLMFLYPSQRIWTYTSSSCIPAVEFYWESCRKCTASPCISSTRFGNGCRLG